MKWFKRLKSHKSALQIFVLLLVGFVCIQIVGIYIANVYVAEKRHQVSRVQLQEDLIHIITLLNIIPESLLKGHMDLLVQQGINRIELEKRPLRNGAIIERSDPDYLERFAFSHYFNFRASYQLASGQWITLYGGVQRTPFLLTGFILCECFLFVLLMILCIGVISHLAIPVVELERAIKRFGVDQQLPPMAIQGTSQMQRLIMTFNQMQSRVRRLIVDRTQLLVAVSHDLRTPLTRLRLRIEALPHTEDYQKAESDLIEMDRMISSILAVARDNSQVESVEWLDLNQLLKASCNDLQDTGMSVTFTSDVSSMPYLGRVVALKRAFVNLIENAVKYGERAEVTLETSNNEIRIKIQDYGPGIPKEEMERVFTPFYRLDSEGSAKKSGTGLGMTVAREIIRAHGGEIALYNHKYGGLLVLVTLPLGTAS